MGTAINLDDIKRFEVTEVYSHPDAKVDIVLVHGLNGHPRNTWTAKNGVFWPSQLLPVALKSAQARVLVYGYNADVLGFSGSGKGPSTDMLHHHAQTLLVNLSLERKSEERGNVPIIWIAHSLGGILVKRALELSHDLAGKNADDLRSIYVSSYGVIFLGTPHNGADAAKWGVILQRMVNALVPKKLMESQGQLIKTLQSNNETLQNINLRFLDIYPDHLQVCMVHETRATDLKGTKAMIVDQTSAGPLLPDVIYFGIEQDHSAMCKFESKNAPGWTNISVTLKSWVQEAEPAVRRYWADEMVSRRQKDESEMDKLKSKYQRPPNLLMQTTGSAPQTPDPSSVENSTIIVRPVVDIEPTSSTHLTSPIQSGDESDAYFVKPSGFRPNSIFVGRDKELEDLHKMLFDRRRRGEGTSAVLIQSLPGGGKTHLARQYVYKYKTNFPGGIFWIRAKSHAELASGFWDIARKAALKDDIELGDCNINDPEPFIEMVVRWLNHRHDWLMVLDGIRFDDNESIRRFIPDSKNTSLIYTSTERSVVGDYHFMNPQIIKLPLLSAREAQCLMLLELGKEEPFSKDDLKSSMELVQSMGFLPVVIHSVAQRLKTTNEPLSKFAKHYSSEPRLRGLGTFVAVVDQLKDLKAVEALNLIYLISFFSQHIPVEMISLGVRALDVPVKAMEPDIGRNLNNTFKVLNMFALVDRNEQDATVQTPRSAKERYERLTESIDVIRVHSVVQGFFMDTLAADHTLPIWLERAISLFCCSYDFANDRIMRKANAGLVEDYRLYEIHGLKLQEHLTRFIGKRMPVEQKEMLIEAQDLLWTRLDSIRNEIERRTPESSFVISGGGTEIFQTSIFDRTSSSSDIGIETPAFDDNLSNGLSIWGISADEPQHESPSTLTRSGDNVKDSSVPYSNPFPLLMPEDIGYDSDREDTVTVTPKSSRNNPQFGQSVSAGQLEDLSPDRSPRTRSRGEPSPLGRPINVVDDSKPPKRAPTYRSASAAHPHLTTEIVQGFLQGSTNRELSRGRVSGQSSAEAALTNIVRSSPPPARGGALIIDRRTSSQRSRKGKRMISGISSYASPVSSPTIEPYAELIDASTFPNEISTKDSRPSSSSAKLSLKRFPADQPSSPVSPHLPIVLMPPYPQTPCPEPEDEQDGYANKKVKLSPINFDTQVHADIEAFLPPEMSHPQSLTPNEALDSPKLLSGSLPPTLSFSRSNEDQRHPLLFSPLNARAIRRGSDMAKYLQSRSEVGNQGGSTSQPMSRGSSGQSAKSTQSTGLLERRRKSSGDEMVHMPRLPMSNARHPPTGPQIYERMKEKNMLLAGNRELELEVLRREREKRLAKTSPRLQSARAALIDHWDDQNVPITLPRPVATPSYSPPLPQTETLGQSPPRGRAYSAEVGERVPRGMEVQQAGQKENTQRSESAGSGGFMVGRRLVGFGEVFTDDEEDLYSVSNDGAFGRSERERERDRSSSGRSRAASPRGSIRDVRINEGSRLREGVGLGLDLDMEEE